jgi:hypothetical protein
MTHPSIPGSPSNIIFTRRDESHAHREANPPAPNIYQSLNNRGDGHQPHSTPPRTALRPTTTLAEAPTANTQNSTSQRPRIEGTLGLDFDLDLDLEDLRLRGIGVDVNALKDEKQQLEQWLRDRPQAEIDRMARNFEKMEVCEQDVVQFTGANRDAAIIVIDARPSMRPLSAAAERVHRAADKWNDTPLKIKNQFDARDAAKTAAVPRSEGYARWSDAFEHRAHVPYIIHAVCPMVTPPMRSSDGQPGAQTPTEDLDQAILKAHASSYTMVRETGGAPIEEIAVSPLFASTGYPRERAARLTIQAALEEAGRPDFNLRRLQPTSGTPDAFDRDFEAMASLWHAANRFLRDHKTPAVPMTPRPPRGRRAPRESNATTVGPTSGSAGSAGTVQSRVTAPSSNLRAAATRGPKRLGLPGQRIFRTTTGGLKLVESSTTRSSAPPVASRREQTHSMRGEKQLTAAQKKAERDDIRAVMKKAEEDREVEPRENLKASAYLAAMVKKKWALSKQWLLSSMIEVTKSISEARASEIYFLESPPGPEEQRIRKELEDTRPPNNELPLAMFDRGMRLWGDLEAKDGLPAVPKTKWGCLHLAKITGVKISTARDRWELHYHEPAEVQAIAARLGQQYANAKPEVKYCAAHRINLELKYGGEKGWRDANMRVFAGGITKQRAQLLRTKVAREMAAASTDGWGHWLPPDQSHPL